MSPSPSLALCVVLPTTWPLMKGSATARMKTSSALAMSASGAVRSMPLSLDSGRRGCPAADACDARSAKSLIAEAAEGVEDVMAAV